MRTIRKALLRALLWVEQGYKKHGDFRDGETLETWNDIQLLKRELKEKTK